MPRIADYEYEQQINRLKGEVNKLSSGARDSGPVNDILEALILDLKTARRGLEIAHEIWRIENAEDNARAAAERITNLLEWGIE